MDQLTDDDEYLASNAPENNLTENEGADDDADDIEMMLDTNAELSKNVRKNTSRVWDSFLKYKEGGVKKAKCKKCTTVYKIHGTTNLIKHLNFLCLLRDLNVHKVGNIEFDQRVFRKMMGDAVVRHNLPFRFVEYKGIRKLLTYANPLISHISGNTMKSDIVRTYQSQKEDIKRELDGIESRICLTSDMWTSIKGNGYMTLTAHYVDNDWILQRRVLIFRHVPPPHDGTSIGQKLISFLKEWGIDKKIFTLTLDNASYNTGVVKLLIKQFRLTNSLVCGGIVLHIRCGAHILNLIVHDGLKIIDTSIEKIRESVKYIRGHEGRRIRFLECAKELGIDSSKFLEQDTPTRWNSTYLMIESALFFKSAFFEYAIIDNRYKWCPTEIEWLRIQRIANFLKPFYEMTKLFSGSKYPTSNHYFINVWKIQLLEELMFEESTLKEIAKGMKDKFIKYWDEYSPILTIAFALDPRYKLKFVELALSKVNKDMVRQKVCEIKRHMKDLFEEYLNVAPQTSTMSSTSRVVPANKVDEYMDEFDAIQSQGERERSESQLEQYLTELVMDGKKYPHLDLLAYWKQNDKYPDLAKMARDVLSIPITTVASESVFSHGGRIIGKYHSRILPENAEAKLCSRDWYEAYSSDEDEDGEELPVNNRQTEHQDDID